MKYILTLLVLGFCLTAEARTSGKSSAGHVSRPGVGVRHTTTKAHMSKGHVAVKTTRSRK